ncbi:MAG: hypothetical protein HFI77_14515 [Lachnospiraceae bacterium]|nr:hypothetical protein [Lachnospiraceae bacterium]
MRNAKLFCLVIVNIVLSVFIIDRVQGVLIPKDYVDCTDAVDGFYDLEPESVDVLVIGSSNAFCTINPLELYSEFGITAYDFCTSAQPISITSLYLKEALKYQKPQVVCLEVYMVADRDNTEMNETVRRWGYNDIKPSIEKIRNLYEVTKRNDDDFLTYLLPIIKYKERWKGLTETDFIEGETYTKGYFSTEIICSEPLDFEQYKNSMATYSFEPIKLSYLDQIRTICDEAGIELLLFKAPRVDWDISQSNAIREYAEKYNLTFLDYMELMETIGINNESDFRDPWHLNNAGAKKVTLNLGQYIKEHYDVKDRRNGMAKDWDADIVVREEKMLFDKLAEVNSFDEYLSNIRKCSNLIIMINTGDKYEIGYDEIQILESLLGTNYEKKYNHSIIANKKLYLVNENTEYVYLEEGKNEFLIERLDNCYNYYINRQLYSMDSDIGIIVFDKTLNQVIDVALFSKDNESLKRVEENANENAF